MLNPVEVIGRSSKRLARHAVAQELATWVLPLALTIALWCFCDRANSALLSKSGYLVGAHGVAMLAKAIVALALSEIVALLWLAFDAWRRTNDFAVTAQKIDDAVGARQEIVTLATLADPTRPEQKDRRSPLFAMLWRRVIAHLELFNPRREFRFDAITPLKRSTILSVALALLIALATIALMRLASPTQAAAYRMRELADKLDGTSATTSDHETAEALRDVARDLESPRLPPRQKIAELQSIKQEIAKLEQQKGENQSGSGNAGGNGNGSGNSSGSGATGKGEGKGQGATDKGEGSGSGGPNQGAQGDKQGVQLQSDIAKAQAKLEEENNTSTQSQTAQTEGKTGSGLVPQPGSNPNLSGPQSKPNGSGNIQLPGGGRLADSQAPPSSNGITPHSGDKGSQGDTHLGDFPKAANYDRYYKLGDKGPPIDIKNARYVTFRLPASIVSGGEAAGRVVGDTGSPAAKTPYTNAPLKEQRMAASPDEEQLLPPRYRDLIR